MSKKKRAIKAQRENYSGSVAQSDNSSTATLERPSDRQKSLKSTFLAPAGTARVLFILVAALFLLSGFSGLVYQVIWTRMLVLVFGGTTMATSTVLAIFMGGLAAGSFIAGHFADRIKRTLLWYGLLEAAIGIWALVTPTLLDAAVPLYKWIWLNVHASQLQFNILRFVCTAVVLLPPTSCMGATLPLLAKFVGRSLRNIGERIGTLYAVNTLGAIAGAAVAGFCLLPGMGLSGTTFVSAGINFFLLIAVLITYAAGIDAPEDNAPHRRNVLDCDDNSGLSDQPGGAAPSAITAHSTHLIGTVMVAFAISGAVAMVMEVCWTRALLMVIGSSTYAFSVMLTAFLAGIFIGSLVCSRLVDRLRSPLLTFAALQICLGGLTLVSMQAFNVLPFWNLQLSALAQTQRDLLPIIRFGTAGIVLLPITIFLGAIFPVAVKLCATGLDTVGKSVGFLYASNTIGAIAGALLAGFLLIPCAGPEKTLVGCAVVNCLLGACLSYQFAAASIKFAEANKASPVLAFPKHAIACAAVVVSGLALTIGSWDHLVLLNAQSVRRGLFHRGFEYKSFEQWRKSLAESCKVEYWADGACSSVGVIHHRQLNVTSLITNGHIDASDDADLPVQGLIPGLPLLLNDQIKNVAVVGWGSGQTVGTALQFPGVTHVDAIELEPDVIPASKFFHHVNHAPENDPRVQIIYNDGRNFLLATDKTYDLIASEPSNPWQAGVCNLFTQEYFQICKQRLNDRGILSLWLQAAEIPPADLCGVMAALDKVFPHTVVFYPRPGTTIVLASQAPIVLNAALIQKRLQQPSVGAELKSFDIPELGSLLGRIAIASDGMKGLVGNAFFNTDDNNHLEFDVGKSYEDELYTKQNKRMLSALAGSPWDQVDWTNIAAIDQAAAMARAAEVALPLEGEEVAMGWLDHSIRIARTPLGCKLYAAALARVRKFDEAERELDTALRLAPGDGKALAMRGAVKLVRGDRPAGLADLQAASKLPDGKQMAQYVLQKTASRSVTSR